MLLPLRTGQAPAARARVGTGPVRLSAVPWLLVVVTLLGAVLRFATLSGQSLWLDEATTVRELHLSLGGLLHAMRVSESTPPLYYALAWVWARVFGFGEVGLRSLSAVAGTALIPVAYLCGRELVSRRAGLLAAALAAVNPFLIWYSQEARAYMLFALLGALSLWLFARARSDPGPRALAGWTAVSILALLTHFFAGFLIAAEALLLLIAWPRRAVIAAVGGLLAVQVALVPLLVGDVSHPLLDWIKQFPLSVRVQQVPASFGLGALYQSSLVDYGLLGGLVLALVALVLIGAGGSRAARRGAAIAGLLAAAVILVPLGLALAGIDYFVPRNMIIAWVPLAVVIGAACTPDRLRAGGAALAGVLLTGFIAAGVQISSHAQYQRPDWRGVAAALGPALRPRAIVAYDGKFAAQPLQVYLPGAVWPVPAGKLPGVDEIDVVGSPWQSVSRRLPAGVRLIGTRTTTGGFLVARFSVGLGGRSTAASAGGLTAAAIAAQARGLLGPAPAGAEVLIQRRT